MSVGLNSFHFTSLPFSRLLLPKFVTGFDESENKVTYSKQMDIHIIYYDENTKILIFKMQDIMIFSTFWTGILMIFLIFSS